MFFSCSAAAGKEARADGSSSVIEAERMQCGLWISLIQKQHHLESNKNFITHRAQNTSPNHYQPLLFTMPTRKHKRDRHKACWTHVPIAAFSTRHHGKQNLISRSNSERHQKLDKKCVKLEHPARLTQFCVMNYSFIHSMKHYMTSNEFAMKIRTCL